MGKPPSPLLFRPPPPSERHPSTGIQSCHRRRPLSEVRAATMLPPPHFSNWVRPLPLPHSCRAAGVPRGNAGHPPGFPRYPSPSRQILSATPPSHHLLGEPPPLAPCLARPPLNDGAYPGRHFPPRPPGCHRAPRHRITPRAVTTWEWRLTCTRRRGP
jgi:hypothetical protein